MEIFLVGGAVRDALLGIDARERDWVVVGSTPDAMQRLGYRQVGRDFPVFLHPTTNEEYALARTERKVGPGHTGFVCHAGADVTLEDDLRRRDLTINAIAQAQDGTLIDPWGGAADLAARRLRHVSGAFAEDPLRVFRVARFAAQLGAFGFEVDATTMRLMSEMCRQKQLDELAPERVWQEFVKALAMRHPQRFFEVLAECGGLRPWFAELESVDRLVEFVSRCARLRTEALDRYAILGTRLGPDAARSMSDRLKAPNDFRRAIVEVARFAKKLVSWRTREAAEVLEDMKRIGVIRQPEWFARIVLDVSASEGTDLSVLSGLGRAIADVRSEPLRERGISGPELGEAMDRERIELIRAAQR